MTSSRRLSLGRLGESLAAAFLEKKGYAILERNKRTPYGEIDLIAQLGDVIVFVEVKTRSNTSLGPPEISITPRKSEHMRSAAEYFIQEHPAMNNDWRIDAVAIQFHSKNSQPLIDHFENVIS